ncbi:MAG: TRZ/ATZ family hydrolase [Proteobacteria bacterium]|nr:TRZ/ATZ family hydrolase [Pseudomonadota bacterium]
MQAPLTIDTLVEARWIIPIEPHGLTLEHHAVAIEAGRIVDILPIEQARSLYHARNTVRLPHHVLLPGLINLHTHAAMSLLRGYADDVSLMDWLNQRIWPAEAKHVSSAFVRDGTFLACAEMLCGGVTCFNDMYFHPEAAAEAALRMGMRASLGIVTIEFPTAYAADADDYLSKGIAARDALLDEPLISFCMAPHAPYTVADRSFERIATLAAQLDLPIHMHLHETRAEIENSIKQYGVRPIERLHRLGLLGSNLIAVHAVHLEAGEIDLLAEQGCSVAHCPTSNMKLSSGIAPVADLVRHGVRIGLGSDGAASNNRLDMFREMNHAALLAKVASGDATVLDAHSVLHMATLAGAAALGQDKRIGSLVAGKQADLCAVRLNDPGLIPCYDPASHLVHAAGREHVSHVWVAGEIRVEEGILLNIDTAELVDISNLWQNKLN